MPNLDVFFLIAVCSFVLFIVGIFLKPLYERDHTQSADLAGFDLCWQLSLMAFFTAIMPIPLYYIGLEHIVWRISSLMFAVILFIGVVAIGTKMMSVGARSPLMTIFLLVLSLFFIIIELLNMIFWSGSVQYLVGVFWIMGLAGGQYLSVYTYDYLLTPPKRLEKRQIPNPEPYRRHGAMDERLRREQRANHPNRPPDNYANLHDHRVPYRQPERQPYTHPVERTRPHRGWTIPNAVVRSDQNTRPQ